MLSYVSLIAESAARGIAVCGCEPSTKQPRMSHPMIGTVGDSHPMRKRSSCCWRSRYPFLQAHWIETATTHVAFWTLAATSTLGSRIAIAAHAGGRGRHLDSTYHPG